MRSANPPAIRKASEGVSFDASLDDRLKSEIIPADTTAGAIIHIKAADSMKTRQAAQVNSAGLLQPRA